MFPQDLPAFVQSRTDCFTYHDNIMITPNVEKKMIRKKTFYWCLKLFSFSYVFFIIFLTLTSSIAISLFLHSAARLDGHSPSIFRNCNASLLPGQSRRDIHNRIKLYRAAKWSKVGFREHDSIKNIIICMIRRTDEEAIKELTSYMTMYKIRFSEFLCQ